ncbi:MAG: transposase-like protein [Psychromonas sp.]|jgi:transposase-like protein
MLTFTKDFNCCKTVHCENFAVVNSTDYIQKSRRLGYLSIGCKLCGSYPPWVNNELVEQITNEKNEVNFARKLTGCPKCSQYFFFDKSTESISYGYTSAGTQRKKCSACHAVFTQPYFKNINGLRLILNAIMVNQEIKKSIKVTGLSARLYYFYLDKLAQILVNFSRLNEEKVIQQKQLSLYTQGKVVHLSHKRGFYTLLTSDTESGYLFLQNHNLMRGELTKKGAYNEQKNTIISVDNNDNLEMVLIKRYEQHLKRKHFEQLLVGELKPFTKCHLIYPDKLAYAHFQLLTAFTEKASSYTHYIEHESCFRSAALMASAADIKTAKADVYFYLASPQAGEYLKGKKIGWWGDKWFSNDFGAYCPIVSSKKFNTDLKLSDTSSNGVFSSYLDSHLNKGINSINVIDNLSEIHRTIFNYCELKNKTSRAKLLKVTDRIYTPQSLLDAALKTIMNGY